MGQVKINSKFYVERAEEVENQGIIEGYFIKYNSPAQYGNDDYYEVIAPGALTESLAKNTDVKCFYNHNYDYILGRQSNNTLTLTNDESGLFGTVRLNLNDSVARDVFERVKRGDINGCSFGAYITQESYDPDTKTVTVRKLDLQEVSVCPMPFYDATTMEARAKKAMEIQEIRKVMEAKYGSKSVETE